MLLDLIPAPYRVLGAAISVLAITAVAWLGGSRYGLAEGRAERDAVIAEQAAAAVRASEAARASEKQRSADLKENANEAQRLAARDRARIESDAARVAAVSGRVRDHTDSAVRTATCDPGTASQCPAIAAALGELFDDCRDRYAALGRQADGDLADARRRGVECAADWDALSR